MASKYKKERRERKEREKEREAYFNSLPDDDNYEWTDEDYHILYEGAGNDNGDEYFSTVRKGIVTAMMIAIDGVSGASI
jgi:hypothetical protein